MRREKHITIKATLLALISVVAGTYMLYNIDNFINLLAHSEVLKEMNPSMVIFLKDMSRIALLLMFILSMLTFGKNYDQLSFLNIFISFMLGYSFGALCGLIRYYFFSQYYGTVGMRIVELILIFFMFAVPHRMYSMKRYDIEEPKPPREHRVKKCL